jgi:hypothetical protein
VQLVGAQPVGPDARRVDHAGGADLQLPIALAVTQLRADGAAALLQQADRVHPVDHHRPEALRFPEHGEHEPRVVRLAVVEEVAAARLAPGERRQQFRDLVAVDDPMAGRAPVRLLVARGGAAAARGGRPP